MNESQEKNLRTLVIDLRQMAERAAALSKDNQLDKWRQGYDSGRHVAYKIAALNIEEIVGRRQ